MFGQHRKRVEIKESSIQEHDKELLGEFIERIRYEYGRDNVNQFELLTLASKILHERR